jgi:hypothetical protein
MSSLNEQIEKSEFFAKHLQPEINEISNLIVTILKRCPNEDRQQARTLLTSDVNWWINEADVDYDPSKPRKILEDLYDNGEIYEVIVPDRFV